MSSSGRSALSVYAREILELHPVWRFRGISGPGDGPGNAGQPDSESPVAEALPLPSEGIQCWSVSIVSAPVSVAQREALQRAAALALAPAGSLSLHWEDHLLPESAGQTGAQRGDATAEGPLSLQALQNWLVAQQKGRLSDAPPRVVLVWGAAFSGPVALAGPTGPTGPTGPAAVADPADPAGPVAVAGPTGPAAVADPADPSGTWLLGLPAPGQFSTAAARRQTWADLLALKRLRA